MPTSSDELRAKMTKRFGSIDLHGPQSYLQAQGYTLTPEWYWRKPSPDHEPTPDERDCAQFLIEEWDYDGID